MKDSYPKECPNCGIRSFVKDDFGNWYCHNCGWIEEGEDEK